MAYLHYGDIHASKGAFMQTSAMPRISADLVSSLPRLRTGDLVMADASEDYDGIGKCVEIEATGDAVAGLHTLLMRPREGYWSQGFVRYLQLLGNLKSEFIKIANGISVYGVSKNSLREIALTVPFPKEQTAIAAVLSDMDVEVVALEAQLAKTRDLKNGMMQDLLTGRVRLTGTGKRRAA